jgi:hypothetical protein
MRMHERNPAANDRGGYGIRSAEVQSGNIGYIELSEFADFEFGRPDEPARRAIETALHRVRKADAIIVDVREKPRRFTRDGRLPRQRVHAQGREYLQHLPPTRWQ